MPRALPLATRSDLRHLWAQGVDSEQAARSLHLAPRTVRHWFARFRSRTPEQACSTCYEHSGDAYDCPDLQQRCCSLRREHPRWGAGRLRLTLIKEFPNQQIPRVRTLQRWLHAAGLAPRPPVGLATRRSQRATEPHQAWQMDAAELLPLAGGQKVSWLRIVDEASGAFLGTRIFPPRSLGTCACARGTSRLAPLVRALGPSGPDPGGQRPPLGQQPRFAAGAGLVGDGIGGEPVVDQGPLP